MSEEQSSAPRNFMMRCASCNWGRASSGLKSDLADLAEVKANCNTCGKWRRYRCPRCGAICPLKRIKGNS